MCETTDRSVKSCSVEEHQEISIMELMKMWIDPFLNEMKVRSPSVINSICPKHCLLYFYLAQDVYQHLDARSQEVSFPSHMILQGFMIWTPKKLKCRVLLPW